MKVSQISKTFFLLTLLSTRGESALHQVSLLDLLTIDNINCFTKSQDDQNTPEKQVPKPYIHDETSNTWCLVDTIDPHVKFGFKINTNPDHAPNDKAVLPELSAMYELYENGAIKRITQGSRVKGVLEIVSINEPKINPFPVPLSLSSQYKWLEVDQDASFFAQSDTIRQQIEATLSNYRKVSEAKRFSRTRPIVEGEFKSILPIEKHPYGAYWWSHDYVELAAGPESPLGKYDAYVFAKTGVDPKSREWEMANHSLQGVPWGGHCNGWAASSVLHKEVEVAKWSKEINKVMLVSDFNGMLAEASFCVDWAFYGKRFNGSPGDDITDIHADRFHKVLEYYIDRLKKPVAMDYIPNYIIDNNVVVGYKMKIKKDPAEPLTYNVETNLQMYEYDQWTRDEISGTSQGDYERSYEYKLVTDDAGNITSGTWISENPDFLWVPLAQKKCGRENPRIDHEIVLDAMNNLPDAKNYENPSPETYFKGKIAPGESVKLPFRSTKPFLIGFKIAKSTFEKGTARITFFSDGNYPLYWQGQVHNENFWWDASETGSISETLGLVRSIEIKNTTNQEIEGEFALESITSIGEP